MKEYQINTLSQMDEISNYIMALGLLIAVQSPRQNSLEIIFVFLCYCIDMINTLVEKGKW